MSGNIKLYYLSFSDTKSSMTLRTVMNLIFKTVNAEWYETASTPAAGEDEVRGTDTSTSHPLKNTCVGGDLCADL